MKGIIRGALQGIGMALFLFCVTCSIFDITEGGRFVRENYQMTKMVIGSVICGIAWGAPSVIYNKDSLPRAIQILIHMGIGCAVYTVVAFTVGWIPAELSAGKIILIFAIEIGIAFLIWLGFHFYYKREARRMNERIHSMK